jgi:hypothetical protein
MPASDSFTALRVAPKDEAFRYSVALCIGESKVIHRSRQGAHDLLRHHQNQGR